MTYLILQTAAFLMVAAVLGFFIGWLIRHSRARLQTQQQQAGWEVKFASLTQARDEAIAQSEADRARSAALEEEVDKHRKHTQKLDEELSPMRRSFDEMRGNRLSWEKSQKEMSQRGEAVAQKLRQVEEERDRIREELGEFQKALRSSTRSLTFHKEVSQSSQTVRRELFKELSDARKSMSEALKAAESARAEAHGLRRELESLRKRHGELEGLYEESQSADGPSSLSRSMSPLSNSADVHTLSMALERARARIDALEDELSALSGDEQP